MDELFGLLNEGEPTEPILCGYFNKVIGGLLGKIKNKLLQYILLKRGGDIFDRLVANLQHHSLAQLLVELLHVKIVNGGGSRGGSSAKKSEGFTFHGRPGAGDSENEEDEEEDVPSKMTAAETKMAEVLTRKQQEVVVALVDLLGAKNKDLEKCLGA